LIESAWRDLLRAEEPEMGHMSRRIPLIATTILCLATLAGCQTTSGKKQSVTATVGAPSMAPAGQVMETGKPVGDADFAAAVAAIASTPGTGVRQVGPAMAPSMSAMAGSS
jgi:predicted small secreted protein